MSFAGLISGVMGGAAKGVSDVSELEMKKQSELDMRKQLMEAETEKQLRIDEVKRERDITDIGRRTDAETSAYVKSAPIKAKADADVAPIKAKGEAKAQIARTDEPGYLKSVSGEAKAKHVESAGSLATADLARFELANKRAVSDLRTKLSKTSDPTERDTLTQQISDLSGNSSKSYGDMVTAAEGYRKLAQGLRKDLEMVTDPDERKAITDRASYYETEADSILQSTKGKRLGPANPKPDSVVRVKPNAAAPWTKY